jgi:hypothetical protein
MDFSTGRELLQAAESSQDTAPFFGFIGAAAALVFSCEWRQSRPIGLFRLWAPAAVPGSMRASNSHPVSSWVSWGQ